jgi:hypothetical protein
MVQALQLEGLFSDLESIDKPILVLIASFDESLSSRLISTVIRGVFRADFEGPGCLCVRLEYIITSRHINLFRKRILSKGGEANTLTVNSGNIYLQVDQTFDVQYPSAPSVDHCFQTHQRACYRV